ncbi:MAG: electron transfer flavoprotein subunit alpha/FixB family protein [Bdellovibrionota bacterium]
MIVAILESSEAELPKAALVTVQAALDAKAHHGYEKAVGLVLGNDKASSTADALSGLGLDEVITVTSSTLEPYLALNYSAALKEALPQLSPKLVLLASTSVGKDLAPRVAKMLGAAQASDVSAFLPGGGFRRSMYAGNIVAEVELATPVKVATVRLTAFEPARSSSTQAPVRNIAVTISADPRQTFISFDTVKSERPELTEASIVVSGGRAMKSAENFQTYIAPLADSLGAAIGASRAAVDSGYAPNDWQVGQTGKIVAPSLYVAVGISGAIQHLAGMKDSKVIVAVNKDPEAPIFEVADYGLVADLYEAVPELTAEIKKAKG